MVEPGLTRATFRCDACGEPAAIVELVAKDTAHPEDDKMNRQLEDYFGAVGSIVIRDFLTMFGITLNVSKYVSPGDYDALERALAKCDARALHRLYPNEDSKIASFYCRECEAPYCRKHWQLEEVIEEDMSYVDYWLGQCPNGHDLMIDHVPA
jgi:hypothetical protein